MQATKTVGGFRVKKNVTLPVHKLKPGEERYFQFVNAMHVGKDTGQIMNGKKMEPATIADVIDLQTGELGVLICATVLYKEITEQYPDDDYVGKAFAITMTKVPEKKYNLYSILEIEPDEAQQTAGNDRQGIPVRDEGQPEAAPVADTPPETRTAPKKGKK